MSADLFEQNHADDKHDLQRGLKKMRINQWQ